MFDDSLVLSSFTAVTERFFRVCQGECFFSGVCHRELDDLSFHNTSRDTKIRNESITPLMLKLGVKEKSL